MSIEVVILNGAISTDEGRVALQARRSGASKDRVYNSNGHVSLQFYSLPLYLSAAGCAAKLMVACLRIDYYPSTCILRSFTHTRTQDWQLVSKHLPRNGRRTITGSKSTPKLYAQVGVLVLVQGRVRGIHHVPLPGIAYQIGMQQLAIGIRHEFAQRLYDKHDITPDKVVRCTHVTWVVLKLLVCAVLGLGTPWCPDETFLLSPQQEGRISELYHNSRIPSVLSFAA